LKKLAVYSLAVCCLISTSCATLLKGTKEEITVVSDPPGAKVTANESDEGTTPVAFTVPSKQDLNISVTKAGYQEQDLQDPTSFRWGYEIWAFLDWVIPMVVDLSDGAAWGHDHLTMTAHLEPNGQPTPASAESPVAGSEGSEVKASPLASPSPAARSEAIAAAPVLPSAAVAAPAAGQSGAAAASTAPSAAASTASSTRMQPAANVAPSLPVTSAPQ
jgi:PEGA domain